MGDQFHAISEIATRQHGRVTTKQLRKEGVDRSRVTRWVRDGRLKHEHEGVFAVGHQAPSVLGILMSAVLACGDRAAASWFSMAHLYGLIKVRPELPHVSVPTTNGLDRPEISIHRVRALPDAHLTTWFGIPATTVARVLLDIAPRLGLTDLTTACHEAWIRHKVGPPQIESCIELTPRQKGIKKLRVAYGADAVLSVLEKEFVKLLIKHKIPLPRTNIDVAGRKVDCHWPQFGITIELLSFQFHGTRQAFEADVTRRRYTNHLAFTWGDIFERPEQTIREVRRILGLGA